MSNIGNEFVQTNGAFNPLADIEETTIIERESTTIRLKEDVLDRVRAIASVKNKTIQEVMEILTEEYTKNIHVDLPEYKELAQTFKDKFEKRRGPRETKQKKATKK